MLSFLIIGNYFNVNPEPRNPIVAKYEAIMLSLRINKNRTVKNSNLEGDMQITYRGNCKIFSFSHKEKELRFERVSDLH